MRINKNLLIYVVEDNVMYNKLVTGVITKHGYGNVRSFHSGEECINAVKGGEKPDIVIQDYHLDDSTGIDVLLNVKKHSKGSEFVFLTAHENMEVAVNSIKYGAFDYIIKGSDVALKNVVNKIGKIAAFIDLRRRNRLITTVMIVTLVILVIVVLFTFLHTIFNAFGLQRF